MENLTPKNLHTIHAALLTSKQDMLEMLDTGIDSEWASNQLNNINEVIEKIIDEPVNLSRKAGLS